MCLHFESCEEKDELQQTYLVKVHVAEMHGNSDWFIIGTLFWRAGLSITGKDIVQLSWLPGMLSQFHRLPATPKTMCHC